jgi:uncharacterized protein YciI
MSVLVRGALGLLVVSTLAATVPAAQTPSPASTLQVFAVIYSRGPGWTDDAKAFAHPAVKEHVGYFTSLGDRLIAASPFALDAKDATVGMVLMLAESADAANAWASADPAIKAQVMTNKAYRWRVSSIREYKR